MARKEAKVDETKVMQFVEKELAADPDVATAELFERAKGVDSGVKNLSLRQFNARFPLQVKRRQSLADPARKRSRSRRKREGARRSQAGQGRDEVRQVFLRFASELSAAEGRADVVRVVAQVDRYVDEALEAVRR